MKLLYCHVDFYNKAGEPGDFRRLHDIDLNLSSTHVFSYDSEKNALSASPRKTPLPENFWANGEDKTNLYNINVVAGSNGSGKSTIINYLIDLLYYVYLDYGAKKTNIPDSARFDVSPNHNLMVFEEAKKLYVLDLEPSGKKKKSRVKCLFDGKDELSPLPEGIESCAVIHGGRDESRAANAFNKCIKGMKVIYMMNNPTQRDYERNLQRQSGGLRSYFVYDCSLGAYLGGDTAQFFPYEVYKQVRYLFDGNQMKIRNNVRKLIGNDPDKNDEFVMPTALRIRPRIDMLNDGAAQKLLPSLKDFDPENAEEKKAFINNTALNELLGALCCMAFAENAAGIFKKDAKTAVADAAEYVGSVPREHGSPFCEQERAIHAAANAAFTPPDIPENSEPNCIAALPGGRVVGGYRDGTLRVWDAASGQCLKTLEGHSYAVSCLATLDDGRVVSGSDDDTLRVWDAASGQCLKTLKGHGGWVNCVAVLDDGRVVSGSADNTLRVWDAASGQCLKTLEGHGGPVECVAALDDGRVVSGSYDNTLRVWDAASGQCLKTLEGHGGPVTCAAVLDDERVVSGSIDNTLRVWDAASGQCLKAMEGHGGSVYCVAVLDDGRVVSGSPDNTLRVWDATSGKCLKILEGHGDWVNCIAALDDGRVVSGSDDRTLRVWDAVSGQCLNTLEGHDGPVYCAAVLDDGRVVSGSPDRTLRVWDAVSGQCLKVLQEHGDPVYCAAVLDDGRVVSGSPDRTLRVWDAASGQCLKTLKGHSDKVYCVAALDDGRVVSGSRDKTLRVWDAASGHCLNTLEGHGGSVYCVAALDDGRVVSGSRDNTLRVWDAASGQCLQTMEGHSDAVTCATSLDDGRVVSGSWDNTLRVWDAASGQCLKTLEGHGDPVRCLAALDDGRVVSGSDDRTLRVWDVASGQCLTILKGHGGPVYCATSLDDGRVVSGSWDNTLRVWDAASGQCLKILEGHGSPVYCVAALDDGRVVSGSDDGTVRIWDKDTFDCICILSADPGGMLLNKIRHYCIDYIGFLARNGEYFMAGDDGQYAGFRRVDGEDCCYEIPLKTDGGDEEAREKLYSFMTDFIQKYRYTCEPVYTVDFDWGLSSGEENMLRMFSNLFHVFPRDFSSGNYGECRIYNDEFRKDEYNETDECSSVMLFLDEADLTLHPEWQRRLIRLLTAFLPSIYPETCVKDMQLVLSTHSPLLLGDIPSENICYLGKDNNEPGETFGQNIHTILRDGFFLESGTVGAFAGARINGIADRLEEIIENEGKKEKTDGEEVLKNEDENKNANNKPYIRPSEKELADIRKTIDIVANGILRVWLEGKWLETNAVLSEPLCSEEAKKLVEEAKKLPPEEKRYILRELFREDDR